MFEVQILHNFLSFDFHSTKKLSNVMSSINTLFSNAKYARSHSLAVFMECRCGELILVKAENKHSTRVEVKPAVTATLYTLERIGALFPLSFAIILAMATKSILQSFFSGHLASLSIWETILHSALRSLEDTPCSANLSYKTGIVDAYSYKGTRVS